MLVNVDKQVVQTLTTAQAAQALNRKVGTLRIWACKGGPISPVRVNGRLAWPLSAINNLLLGVAK
jgi:hypothetical protein